MNTRISCGTRLWFVMIYEPTVSDRKLILANKHVVRHFDCTSEVAPDGRPYINGFVVFALDMYKSDVERIFPRAYLYGDFSNDANDYARWKIKMFVDVGGLMKDLILSEQRMVTK